MWLMVALRDRGCGRWDTHLQWAVQSPFGWEMTKLFFPRSQPDEVFDVKKLFDYALSL